MDPTLPASAGDPAQLYQLLLEAADHGKSGRWRLAITIALLAAVWLLRSQLIARLPLERWKSGGAVARASSWFFRLWLTDLGGIASAFLLSLGGSIAAALKAGQPITGHLVISAAFMAATSSGLFTWWKKGAAAVKGKTPDALTALLVAGGLGLILAGAGCGATAADVGVAFKGTSSEALVKFMAAHQKWDREHQKALVASFQYREDAQAALAKYRADIQEPMAVAVDSALDAIEAISAALMSVDAGIRHDWGALIGNVVKAFADIAAILERHHIPILPPKVEVPKISQLLGPHAAPGAWRLAALTR